MTILDLDLDLVFEITRDFGPSYFDPWAVAGNEKSPIADKVPSIHEFAYDEIIFCKIDLSHGINLIIWF